MNNSFKKYLKYKKKYLNLKNQSGGGKNNIKINIVDEHNDVLKYIWNEDKKKNYKKKLKLLHFDSHPDMGVLESDKKLIKLLPKVFSNKFPKKTLLDLTEIGNWVPVLVFQGLVDEVIWVAGNWCHQFNEGVHKLVVGIDKESGQMKVASQNDYKTDALDYFLEEDGVVSVNDLKMKRNWNLHVFKFDKNQELSLKKMNKIKKILDKNKWILDIDEDYVSTNNPHGVEFRSMFGQKNYDILMKLWDADVNKYYKYSRNLEKIVRKNLFKNNYDFYINHQLVKNTIKFLTDSDYSKKKSKEMLTDYYNMCKNIFPIKVNTSKLNSEDVYDHDFIIDAGEMTSVPHHISKLPEILRLINNTVNLLSILNKKPEVVTIATSRADKYTPDQQADTINTLVLHMLLEIYPEGKIFRYDRPEFSTAEYCQL